MSINSIASKNAKELRRKSVTLKKNNDYDGALNCLEESKKIYESIGGEKEISVCLNLIGNLYREMYGYNQNQEKWNKAMEYYLESVKLAKKVKAEKENAISLYNIGALYKSVGEWKKAEICYKKSLEKAKKINDTEKISIGYNSIADLYRDQGIYDKALEYFKASLENSNHFEQKKEKLKGKLISLSKIGHLHALMGNWDEAIKSYSEGLNVAIDLDDEKEILIFNCVIFSLYQNKPDFENATRYYEKCLKIALEFGDQALYLIDLSISFDRKRNEGKWQETSDEYYQRISAVKKTENDFLRSQDNLTFEDRIEYNERLLKLYEKIDDHENCIYILGKIGVLYKDKDDLDKAITTYKQILKLSIHFNNKKAEVESLKNLGELYREKKMWYTSIKCFKRNLNILRECFKVSKASNDSKALLFSLEYLVISLQSLGDLYLKKGEESKTIIYYKERESFLREWESEISTYVELLLVDKDQIDVTFALNILKSSGSIYITKCDWKGALRSYELILKILDSFRGLYEDKLETTYKALELVGKSGNNEKKIEFLLRIGDIYKEKGMPEKALDFYERSLNLAKEFNDKKGIIYSLKGMGDVYRQNAETEKEIESYEESLKVIRDVGNKSELFDCFNRLGKSYRQKKRHKLAIECFIECFNIAQNLEKKVQYIEKKDERIKARRDALFKKLSSSNEIGELFRKEKDWEVELDYRIISLRVAQDLDDYKGIIISSKRIAFLLKNKGQFSEALKYYKFYCKASKKIGNKIEILNSFKWMGDLYRELGNLEKSKGDLNKEQTLLNKAIKHYKLISNKSKKFGCELEIRNKNKTEFVKRELLALRFIGDIYRSQHEWDKALSYYNETLELSKSEVRENSWFKDEVSISFMKIGDLYRFKGENEEALKFYQKSLRLSEELGYEGRISDLMNSIGNLYWYEGNWKEALKYLPKKSTAEGYPVSLSRIANFGAKIFGDEQEFYNAILEINQDIDSVNKHEIANSPSKIEDSYSESDYFYESMNESFNPRVKELISCSLFELKKLYHDKRNILNLLTRFEISFESRNDDFVSLSLLSTIGDLYHNKKVWRKSIKFYEKCLIIARDKEDKELILKCLDKKGDAHLNIEELDSALECFTRIIKILKSSDELKNHKKSFWYLEIVGNIHWNMGEWENSLKTYHEMLEISRTYGYEDKIVDSLKLIGKLYRYYGKWEEGKKFYEDLIRNAESRLEKCNKSDEVSATLLLEISISQNIIGNLYKDLGKWDEASNYYRDCLQSSKRLMYTQRSLGAYIGLVLTSYNDLGYLYQDMGMWEESKKYYLKCLDLANRSRKFYLKSLSSLELVMSSIEEQVSISLNNLGRLHQNTGEWKKSHEYFEASRKRSESVSYKEGLSITYNNLGNLYRNRGGWKRAKKYYKQSLQIALYIGDKRIISEVLNNLGNLYQNKGEHAKSSLYCKMSLAFAEDLGHKKSIFYSLTSLGDLSRDQGKWKDAFRYYGKSLKIAKYLKYKKGISIAYNNVGHLCQNIGKWNKAQTLFEKSLKLSSEQINYTERQAIIYNSLGYLFKQKGMWDIAITHYEKSLEISEKIEFRKETLKSHNQLGDIYRLRGNWERADEYLDKSIKLANKLGHKKGTACSLHYIGLYYRIKGDWNKAIYYYDRSLSLFNELGYKKGIAESYRKLANLCRDRGKWTKAAENYDKAMDISRSIDYKLGQARCYRNIAKLYAEKGEWDNALRNYELSIEISLDLGYKVGEARCYRKIANVYRDRGLWDDSLTYYNRSLEKYRGSDDYLGISITYNDLVELYLKNGNLKKAEECLNKSSEIENIVSSIPILEASILKNHGSLLCLKGHYDEAVKVLIKSNEKIIEVGATPYQIDILEKIGDTYIDAYNDSTEEKYVDKAEEYYNDAFRIANDLDMPHRKATARRGLAVVEFRKPDEELKEKFLESLGSLRQIHGICKSEKTVQNELEKKFSNTLDVLEKIRKSCEFPEPSEKNFLESIEILKRLGSTFELQKTLLEYSKTLFKNGYHFKAETVAKSVVYDSTVAKNYELLTKAYLSLGDFSIDQKDKFEYYLKSLKTAEFNSRIYIKYCYYLIFRMQKMDNKPLKDFILLLRKQNKENYFDTFLDSLNNRLSDNLCETCLDQLPKSLKCELDKFKIN